MQGMVAAANQDPRLTRVFSTFTASNPVDLAGYRPREGPGAGLVDLRRVQRAAERAGWLLRQRLQSVRPHLAGQYAGRRGRIAAIRRRSTRSMSATGRGEMVPLRSIANVRIAARSAGDQPVQQLPQRHDQRRPQAGRVLRRCADGDGRSSHAHDAAARLQLRVDRHGVSGARRHPGRPDTSWRWRCCSPTCSWWRCTKAG